MVDQRYGVLVVGSELRCTCYWISVTVYLLLDLCYGVLVGDVMTGTSCPWGPATALKEGILFHPESHVYKLMINYWHAKPCHFRSFFQGVDTEQM